MSEHENATSRTATQKHGIVASVGESDRRKTLRVIVWILAGVAVYGLQYELFIVGKLFCGIYLLVDTLAMIPTLAGQSISRRGGVLMAVAILGLFLYGSRTARIARFYVLKSRYPAIVERVERGLSDEEKDELRRSVIDVDDQRVAFPWGGIVDNWYGVVFDPIDRLADFCGDAGQNAQGFLKDPELQNLFGGTMTRCEQLAKGWYFCWFT